MPTKCRPEPLPLLKGNTAIVNRIMLHAKHLSKQSGYPIVSPNANSMLQYRTIICLGPCTSKIIQSLSAVKRRRPETRIISWWIGSDAMWAKQRKFNVKMLKSCTDIHLCVSQEIKQELASIGINASVVTLVPKDVHKYSRDVLPQGKYTVAVYMPMSDSVYRFKMVRDIMIQTPNVQYLVYGNRERLPPLPSNANVLGWVNDTQKVLKKSHCLLRLTDHDGFPKSIIEAVLMGRYVITNHDYPQLGKVDGVNKVVKLIQTHPRLPDGLPVTYANMYSIRKMNKQLRKVTR